LLLFSPAEREGQIIRAGQLFLTPEPLPFICPILIFNGALPERKVRSFFFPSSPFPPCFFCCSNLLVCHSISLPRAGNSQCSLFLLFFCYAVRPTRCNFHKSNGGLYIFLFPRIHFSRGPFAYVLPPFPSFVFSSFYPVTTTTSFQNWRTSRSRFTFPMGFVLYTAHFFRV